MNWYCDNGRFYLRFPCEKSVVASSFEPVTFRPTRPNPSRSILMLGKIITLTPTWAFTLTVIQFLPPPDHDSEIYHLWLSAEPDGPGPVGRRHRRQVVHLPQGPGGPGLREHQARRRHRGLESIRKPWTIQTAFDDLWCYKWVRGIRTGDFVIKSIA